MFATLLDSALFKNSLKDPQALYSANFTISFHFIIAIKLNCLPHFLHWITLGWNNNL